MRVSIVNPNRLRPAVAPLAVEYVAAALARAGHEPSVMDLCFAGDLEEDLRRGLEAVAPDLVALTLRNSDDCYMASGEAFCDLFRDLVGEARAATGKPVVLGGAGFSATARGMMRHTGADYGVVGDGEESLPALAAALERGLSVDAIPGLMRTGDAPPPPAAADLGPIPALRWEYVDAERYFREGGQLGVETRRGCPKRCVYCADPLSKGATVRPRPPSVVAEEIRLLVERGIDHLHFCDAEVNIPPEHLAAVCSALTEGRLGERVRWYAYATPLGFDGSAARACRKAGCAGMNFGVDSADEGMLRRLGRDHTPADIEQAVAACKAEGVAVMLDLLLGGPGETRESLRRTIEFVRRVEPTCAGVSYGVRLYAGTRLARQALGDRAMAEAPGVRGEVVGNDDLLRPVYYVEPSLGGDAEGFLAECIGDDPRFFFGGAPTEDADYNYNDNAPLTDAIRNGARGAYWRILAGLRGLC